MGAGGGVFTGIRTGWTGFFLLAATVSLLCALAWGVWGRVTVSVEGRGVTLLAGGVIPAVAPASGIVSGLNVEQGARVLSHQVIGEIRNPDESLRIAGELRRLENEAGELRRGIAGEKDPARRAVLEGRLERNIGDAAALIRYRDEISYIRTAATGSVLELLKETGSFAREGERIALVASDLSHGLYLAAFLPAEQGKAVQNGMRAFFSPGTAPPGRYGYIRAVVRDVSTAPVNRETVRGEVLNDTLAEYLTGQGAVIRVVLDLIPEEGSPSGYAWTSGNPYPRQITNGLTGTVIVDLEQQSPLSLLFPYVRRLKDAAGGNDR